jgi:hypothetical protein
MITAARQVLLELASILEDERDKIVFVGGTACSLLFPQEIDPHEGTIDVDVALDSVALAESGIDTLEEKLTYANFQLDALRAGEQHRRIKNYRWFRSVHLENEAKPIEVAVDLLTGQYDDSQQQQEPREVQGLHPSRLRGLDLAFFDPHWVPLSGMLPSGTSYQTKVQVCSPACLLAMKGIAISDRLHGQDKDAFDIDYILRRCHGGPDGLARVLQTNVYWHNGLVQEGLQGVAQAFASLNAIGPTSVGAPDRYPDAEERAIVQQGAFRRVQRLMRELRITPDEGVDQKP